MSFSKKLAKYFNSLLGRADKITPIEVYMVVLVVASVFFATRYFQQQSSSRLILIEVTSQGWRDGSKLDNHRAPYWLSDKLVAGLAQRSLSGRIKAEVIGVDNYALGSDQAQIYLLIRLMADYNDSSQEYSFQGQPLLVGSSVEFKFDGVLVPGQILDNNYPKGGYQQGEFIITTKSKHLEPWVVDGLKIGQRVINRATGESIAELLDIEIVPTQSKQIFSFDRQLLTDNQNYRDVTAKLKIKVTKQDGAWFFARHQRVRLGNKLQLFLDEVTLPAAEIINLEYVAQ